MDRTLLKYKELPTFAPVRLIAIDQIVISVSSFVATLLIARSIGAAEFGVWGIVLIITLLLIDITRSLITAPMMRYHVTIPMSSYRSVFPHINIALLVGALLAMFALLVFGQDLINPKLCVFAGWYFISRTAFELCRGACISYQRGARLLVIDTLTMLVQLSGLIVLYFTGSQLNNIIPFLAATYAGAVVIYVMHWPGALDANPKTPHSIIQRHRHFGGWLALNAGVKWLGANAVLLVMAWYLSSADAGNVRALITVFGPIGIAYQFADNILNVRAAELYDEGKHAQLKRLVTIAAISLSCSVLLLGLIYAQSATWWVSYVLGESFTPAIALIPEITLVYVLLALAMLIQLMLRVTEQTRALFRINVVCAAITLILMPWFLNRFGVHAFATSAAINNLLLIVIGTYCVRRNYDGKR